MPAFDGTGPNGEGPRTGRGLGPCPQDANTTVRPRRFPGLGRGPGFGQRGTGRGLGRRGRGRGRRR